MTSPLVSIIIPCYNGAKTVKGTIFSALGDPYPNLEVIVVDDGSRDDSTQVVSTLSKFDKRVRLITQKNLGVSAARNHGARIASGQYFGFLDADDIYFKNSITERMNVLLNETSPLIMGAFCPALAIDSERKPMSNIPLFGYGFPEGKITFLSTPHSVFNPTCSIIVRSYFEKAGGFDEKLASGEDYDLWHRMLRLGGYFQQTTTCVVGWMQHKNSRVHANAVPHYKQCVEVTERIFAPCANSIPEFENGFGAGLLHLAVTQRAFETAVSLAAVGDLDAAMVVADDISKHLLELSAPSVLLESIRKRVLRTLCFGDDMWPFLWQKVKEPLFDFFERLQLKMGGDSFLIRKLLFGFQTQRFNSGLNVLFLGNCETAEHYEHVLRKVSSMSAFTRRVFIPISSDEYFGHATIPSSRLLNFEVSGEVAALEKALFSKMYFFPKKNAELCLKAVSESEAYITSGPVANSVMEESIQQNMGSGAPIDLDSIDLSIFEA